MIRALGRIPAHPNAARQCQPHQSIGKVIHGEEFFHEPAQSVIGKRQFEAEKFRAAMESLQMLRPAEGFAPADEHGFKQPVAIKKTAIEHGNHRAIFGYELAVEENEHANWLGERKRPGEQKNVPSSLVVPKSRVVSGWRMAHQ